MRLSLSGIPALMFEIGFVVVLSAPVWLAARLVGAAHPTLMHSVAALIVGTFGAVVSIALGGGAALLLTPLSFLLAFRFVLGTSFLGAIGLAPIALAGYAVMIHLVGTGLILSGSGSGTGMAI